MSIRASQTSERRIQERLGASLYKLGQIERKASTTADTPRAVARLLEDVRKLSDELEQALETVHLAFAHYADVERGATAATRRAEALFERSPLPCVLIDRACTVLDANAAAVRLLNCSHRHLAGRSFHLFVGSDRERFLSRLTDLGSGDDAGQWALTLRPRERGAVQATVTAVPDSSGCVVLMLQPANGTPLTAAASAPGGAPNRARRLADVRPDAGPVGRPGASNDPPPSATRRGAVRTASSGLHT